MRAWSTRPARRWRPSCPRGPGTRRRTACSASSIERRGAWSPRWAIWSRRPGWIPEIASRAWPRKCCGGAGRRRRARRWRRCSPTTRSPRRRSAPFASSKGWWTRRLRSSCAVSTRIRATRSPGSDWSRRSGSRRNDGRGHRTMVVSTADFKKGLKIQLDGQPYSIVDFQHVKPGKGGAFVRTKLKHMRQGRVIDNTFRAGEKVELVDFEEKQMQFMYRDDRYHFMDTETYEQISLSEDEVGDARDYLKENTEVEMLFIDGSPATVELPNFLELQIVKTDPGIRGDTASGGSKPATLETGAVVQVPLFLNEGDVIKVDTRSGDYLGRVATAG